MGSLWVHWLLPALPHTCNVLLHSGHDDNDDDDDDNGNDNDDDDDDDPSHQSYLLPARSLHIQTQLEILAAFPPVVEIY